MHLFKFTEPTMYLTKNTVRMHDTDMAGILYFPRQFRFANDAWEDLMDLEKISFQKVFTQGSYVYVIVHAESDYKTALHIGDKLDVKIEVKAIGNTSFTIVTYIMRDNELVGITKTVQVCIDRMTRKKIRVPDELREILSKYMNVEPK